MTIQLSRTTLLLFVLAAAVLPVCAQRSGPPPANPDDDAGWFSFGAGFGNTQYDLSAFGSLNYGRERFAQLFFNGTTACCRDSVGGIGLGGGRSWVDSSGRAAVSGGLIVGNHTKGAGDSRDASAGIYADVQLAVTPIKEVGVGLDLFAQTYGAAGLLAAPRVAYGLRVLFVIEGNK